MRDVQVRTTTDKRAAWQAAIARTVFMVARKELPQTVWSWMRARSDVANYRAKAVRRLRTD